MANADHPPEPTGRPTIPQRTMGPIDREMAKRQEESTRKSIKKSGVRTEARRLHYMDVEPTRGMEHVVMQFSTIEKMAAIFIDRSEAIKSLANKGVDAHDPLESMIKQFAVKWEKWAAYSQGGAAPAEADKFTKEDLDGAYYVLFDTIAQLSINQGLNVNAQSRFFGLLEPSVRVEPTSPSYIRQSGWATEFTRIRAARIKDRGQSVDDLTGFENTRREFIKSLTGHRLNDRVMNRVNWGACTDSILLRGRTGLKLHDKIIEIFEGSAGYQGLLREFNNRNPGRNIQTITDLLVNLDNPQDRNTFMNLFHEALGKAAQERFGDKGTEFVKANLEDLKEKSWQQAHLVENAQEAVKILEGQGGLTEAQKTEIKSLQAELNKVREFMTGKKEDGTDAQPPGLIQKLKDLQTKIAEYRRFVENPSNDLDTPVTGLRARLAAAETLVDNNGLVVGAVYEDLDALRLSVNTATQTLADITAGNAPYTTPPLTADQIQNAKAVAETTLAASSPKLNEALNKYRDTAITQRDRLKTQIQNVETPLEQKATTVDTAAGYFDTELPLQLNLIEKLRQRLDRIVNNPADYPYLTAAQLVEIQNQRDFLEQLNEYINIEIISNLEMQGGELVNAYVNRAEVRDFKLDRDLYQDQLINTDSFLDSYRRIIEGQRDPATRERINGMKLEIALAKGLDAVAESAGPPKVAARASVPRILDKAIEGVNTPTGGERTAQLRRNDLSFEERVEMIRAMLLDHPEIKNDQDLRNTDLWRRVFNDEFILQKAIEFCHEFPLPAGALGNLLAAGNQFTENLIEHLGEFQPARMAEFMTYLASRRLSDISTSGAVAENVNVASIAVARGPVVYAPAPVSGYGAKVFSSEIMVAFEARVRRDRNLGMRAGRSWNVENVGKVREVYDSRITTPHGRLIRIGQALEVEMSEKDPIVINFGGDRVELPLRVNLNKRRGVGALEIWVQANPSLQGINIPGIGNNFDRRWVNLTPALMRAFGANINNLVDLNDALQNMMPGIPPGQLAEVSFSVARTLGDYFLGLLAGEARARFPRFPAFDIPGGNYPSLVAAGYDRISMDASGRLELRRVGGEIVSVDSVLETTNQDALVDDIFTLVGRRVVDIMGA